MNCPRCHVALVVEHHEGIEVDRCPQCSGRWLDLHELDELESRKAPDPNWRRGMVTYSKRASELACPKCGKRMMAFNYRANPLELDACEAGDGYWLDAGEETRVGDLIEQRVRDLYRAASAEESWAGFLKGLNKKSLKDRFRGGRR